MNIQLTEEDYTIEAYINRRTDGRYDEVIQPEGRWKIFTALSELRTSLYNWYDFNDNATVLEVNAGYGAVTGAFLRKGLSVTAIEPETFMADCLRRRFIEYNNLIVENCPIDEYIARGNPNAFDYIILTDVLNGNDEKASVEFLVKLKRLLKADGKFLIALPNKYGLRYLCGNGDADAHIPFGSLGNSSASTHYSRDSLIETVKAAGLDHYKFYYPLPTHTITQAVYSDQYLPKENISERINFYGDRKDEELIADEKRLYKDIIENGTFPFHANSFLLECGRDDNLSEIIYATVTTDRGFESASSTAIRGKTVTKTAIYPEGRKSIIRIYQSNVELNNRSILTVNQKQTSDYSLEMPYIDAPTLSDVLRDIAAAGEKEKFVSIFDELNRQILKSSDQVTFNEFPGADENSDYGPILSVSYIDMIPLNCFLLDGQFIFYDQEFVRYNWPANYVMFRALRYTYGTIPEAQNVIPLEELQARYGITAGFWDQYEAEEVRFVSSNRRYDLYQCFYYKTVWSEDQIRMNCLKLSQTSDMLCPDEKEKITSGSTDNEKRIEPDNSNIIVKWEITETGTAASQSAEQQNEKFYTSPELKAIWEVQLDLLRQFKAICDEHKLTYYLWAGSMLGAVRHEGIIPWDDDIDVAMPRKDFEQFRQICKVSLNDPYYLQSDDERTVFMGGKLRLRNSSTTGFEYREARHGGNWGIWIDILALDFVYRDEKKKRRQLNRINKAIKTCRKDTEKHTVSARHLNHFNSVVTACSETEAGSVGVFTAAFRPEEMKEYELSLFRNQMLLKYQNFLMPVPSKYDTILQMQYKDYTKLLPIEKRKPSHTGIFNPKVPYIIYQKKIAEAFDNDLSRIPDSDEAKSLVALFENDENRVAEPIDFFGYGVGKRIDEATGLVIPSDDTYMTSDKVWHAYPGSKLVLKNRQYHYAIATYNAKPDGTLIYTYCYAPDMNWASYNHDLDERGFIGRDYVFEDERYFRVMLTRLDGGEIPKIAEAEGILLFVHEKNVSDKPKMYYSAEIDQTCTEISQARENIETPLTIALIADTHYAPGTTWDNSLCNIKAVNDTVHFDNIIHLGDLTDGLGSKLLTKQYADYVMNGLKQIGIPTYLTIGNHDTNYFHGNPNAYSRAEQYDAYHSGKDPTDAVRNGADLWYYVDRYPQKLRMLFLGSYDAGESERYGFWEEEIEWVQKTLNETPPDWCVIVFSHVPLLPKMHYWTKTIRNADKLLSVFIQFNSEENRLLGYIHGHNHCDQINTEQGFPIVSLGSNKMEYFTYYKPDGAVTYRRTANTASEDLWDVLVVDTKNRKLDLIRFGAGDNRSVQMKANLQ